MVEIAHHFFITTCAAGGSGGMEVTMDEYFCIKDLNVSFRSFEGIKNVIDISSLIINKGETLGLVGESGAGKSVLALTILKLLPIPPAIIKGGQVNFKGEDLLKKNENEIRGLRGKEIAMIFQDPMSTLNPAVTVGEQVIRVIRNNEKISKKDAEKKAINMMEMVKLPDVAKALKKYPHELSGGQRQRIIIAIALCCGAEFIIADEPTRNLDVTIQAGVLKLLSELKQELKTTILFIANNLNLAPVICDKVGILLEGKIVEMGTVSEIIKKPRHPYTETLLNAIPKSKDENISLSSLRTDNEKLDRESCKYYSRCVKRKDECKHAKVTLELIEGSHYVACLKASKESDSYV